MELTQWNSICIFTVLEYILACMLPINLWIKEGFLTHFSLWIHDREGSTHVLPPLSIALSQSARGISLISHWEKARLSAIFSYTLKRLAFLVIQCSFWKCLSSRHIWIWELHHKEGWPPKNWCFWTVVLEKTFESPLDSKRSNQSTLKEINPEYLLEGLMLKLQYSGHMMQRANLLERCWCWERVRARGKGDDRGWDGWMASPTQRTWLWANSGR